MDSKEAFKEYYFENLEQVTNEAKEQVKLMKEFQEDYPLERLEKLSLDEYALGKAGSKDTLSYKLEFGKYKGIIRIGGGTANKYGVFWNKETNQWRVARQNVPSEQIDEKWNEFRNELYSYINTYGSSEEPLKRNEKDEYLLLKGMDMVLTKMLFLYYPDKFMSIVKKDKRAD